MWFILFMYQMKNFENCMDLLLITNENKLHYTYISFNRFIFNNTKNKNKNTFADIVSNFSVMKKSCKNIKKFF